MNTSTFPQKLHPQTRKSVETVTVSAGFAQLRHFGIGLKAYINDHEAWALVLLAVLLIAGTVLYVDV